MRNHNDIVFGDRHIQLKRIGSGCDGEFKGRNRILRQAGARPTVSMDLNARRRVFPPAQCRGTPHQRESKDRFFHVRMVAE